MRAKDTGITVAEKLGKGVMTGVGAVERKFDSLMSKFSSKTKSSPAEAAEEVRRTSVDNLNPVIHPIISGGASIVGVVGIEGHETRTEHEKEEKKESHTIGLLDAQS